MSHDAGRAFAAEATLFRQWVLQDDKEGVPAAREALIRITALYLAGLALPSWLSVDGSSTPRLTQQQCAPAHSAAKRVPLDHYGEVFDPCTLPPQEPVVGWFADDLADIWHDVITGLNAYEAGRINDALWQWSFNLQCHWGEHATGAIRALHCWLARNTVDLQGR